MPEGMYTPCLAESWTVSPNAKVFEFKLRKGVKFHNGDLMTAEDVVFSFWRYKATHAKLIHDKTEKVEAVGPHLVRYHFKEPFPDFLEYLLPGVTSISWVVPKKYVEKVGDAGFKKNPVGCGPYRFVEFKPGMRVVGEAFEEYWRKVPHIKRIELNTVSEPATRLAMVANELLINAAKHGAPSLSGELHIRVDLEAKEGKLHLSVWNSGQPQGRDEEQVAGLGLQLVRGLIAQDQGRFALKSYKGGSLAEVVIDTRELQ